MKKRKPVASIKDFTVNELPQTRKDQFWHILQNNRSILFKCGLIMALCFLLPILIETVFLRFDSLFYKQFEAAEITKVQYNSLHLINTIVVCVADILFAPLIAVGLSGTNWVISRLIKGDLILFSDDFKIGLKKNYNVQAILFTIAMIIVSLFRFFSEYFGAFEGSVLQFTFIPLYIGIVLIIIPLGIISLSFSSNYNGKILTCIKNSFLIYLSGFWQIFVFVLVLFAFIYFPPLLGNEAVVGTIYLALIIFLLPIFILCFGEFMMFVFDKYINSKYYPDQCFEGLYNAEKQIDKKQ